MTQVHQVFRTTGVQGLRHEILPMRLYHKAKRLGIWNPRDIDFSHDLQDWQRCTQEEQETLLTLTALFQAGEESVTLDLLPLIAAVAREGHLEEEMFLTTFLWEEAKHTEFFRRFLDDVVHIDRDLHYLHTPSYRTLFYEELPRTMSTLNQDHSQSALLKAAVTYNMIVEGVLAETGYQAYFDVLERNNIFPGLKQGVAKLKQDESRHIAYGIFLISRLIAQNPSLWSIVETRMNELLPLALGVIQEIDIVIAGQSLDILPFGIKLEEYIGFAIAQFTKRVARIEKAREQTLEQLYQLADSDTETG